MTWWVISGKADVRGEWHPAEKGNHSEIIIYHFTLKMEANEEIPNEAQPPEFRVPAPPPPVLNFPVPEPFRPPVEVGTSGTFYPAAAPDTKGAPNSKLDFSSHIVLVTL